MNDIQRAFLNDASDAATKAGHVFPEMAACEAAEESAWGHSALATEDKNLFGMKQHAHPVYDTVNLPTKEFLDGKWETVTASWVKYPDWASCFADRMATLQRLSNVYPHYKAALEAQDPETYIRQVSMTWSTDPNRADKILDVYRDYTSGGVIAT